MVAYVSRWASAWVVLLSLVTSLAAPPVSAEEQGFVNESSFYPEGPLWHAGKLYYAEMSMDRIMVWDGKANSVFWQGPECGPTTIARSMAGGFYIFCHMGNRIQEISALGFPVRTITRDMTGEPVGNPNESVSDSIGGVYFTSSGIFGPNAPPGGRVFYITPGGEVRKVASGIAYANGLALTRAQDRLIVGAHLERKLLAYPVTSAGHLGPAQPFLDLNPVMDAPGRAAPWFLGPDGLLFDKDSNLYVCEYGGGRVLIFDRSLKLRKELKLGSLYVNAATFGATEQVLYVGAADSNSEGKLPGKVYEIRRPLE